jgi:hypothetical protein
MTPLRQFFTPTQKSHPSISPPDLTSKFQCWFLGVTFAQTQSKTTRYEPGHVVIFHSYVSVLAFSERFSMLIMLKEKTGSLSRAWL